ncbi:MAG: hypothetical protein AAB568_02440 [Patescibacteria group bacterium]
MKKKMAFWTINTILAILWICVLGAQTTACDRDNCYHNYFPDYSEYPDSYHDVNVDAKTPSGIQVDTGGFAVDLAELDRRVAKIEECVLSVMRNEYAKDLDIDTQMAWGCWTDNFNDRQKLKRDCLIIKLVPPIAYSEDGQWQLLDATAPQVLCKQKGLSPDAKNPCRYRVLTVDENILVTPPPDQGPGAEPTSPPAPYLWELVSIMTGCTQIWNNAFAKCASF